MPWQWSRHSDWLFNNTLFSLMHEAVHGISRQRSVNEFAGFVQRHFPDDISSPTFVAHDASQNNRSSVERFDYYEADDFHFLKVASGIAY